jgi:hypothetical protein
VDDPVANLLFLGGGESWHVSENPKRMLAPPTLPAVHAPRNIVVLTKGMLILYGHDDSNP